MTPQHHAKKAGHRQATLRAGITAASCAFALAACHSSQTPQTPAAGASTAASTPASAQNGPTRRASPFTAKPAGAAAFAADNYEALLKRYPAAQQKQIKAWYASHAADSMSFGSDAQWQWMQQHDYPTPDDVLRASGMSEIQLRDLAKHGDTKANFFYLVRLLDDFAQANKVSAAPSQNKTQLRAEMSASMDRALASRSAFAGYLFGGYYAALHGTDAASIGRAAGLGWAFASGDSNAFFNNKQMLMGFPGVSGVRVTEVYFDMVAAAARINPYFLNTYRSRGEGSMPSQFQRQRR